MRGGPSVTGKVMVAFVLPVLAFTAALSLFGWLAARVVPQKYETLVAVAGALFLTTVLMWAVSLIPHRRRRHR